MQTRIIKVNSKNPNLSQIKQAAKTIRSGGLIVFPTETVYGIGANALDSKAVKKIFDTKGRPADNPLIVHISDVADLGILADNIPKIAFDLIGKFWPGPLTIVLKKSRIVPKITTGGLDTVAIRMPKNKIALELISHCGTPIAAPSANVAGRPSPTRAQHVIDDLSGKVGIILDGGPARIGIESTVIDLSTKTPMLLRPGGITLEQLQKVLGKIAIHPIIHGRKTKTIHRSPGMKYRHYSPMARIILIEGSKLKVSKKISQLLQLYKRQGLRVGILGTNIKSDMTITQKNQEQIAANLFRSFREFDAKKIDIILAQGTSRKGLGMGIMNRLDKAAYRKINV
ncbi:MAG: L-threonylcarbamoyladenylate synthase [Candidatus Nitrosotenuis sp.]